MLDLYTYLYSPAALDLYCNANASRFCVSYVVVGLRSFLVISYMGPSAHRPECTHIKISVLYAVFHLERASKDCNTNYVPMPFILTYKKSSISQLVLVVGEQHMLVGTIGYCEK